MVAAHRHSAPAAPGEHVCRSIRAAQSRYRALSRSAGALAPKTAPRAPGARGAAGPLAGLGRVSDLPQTAADPASPAQRRGRRSRPSIRCQQVSTICRSRPQRGYIAGRDSGATILEPRTFVPCNPSGVGA